MYPEKNRSSLFPCEKTGINCCQVSRVYFVWTLELWQDILTLIDLHKHFIDKWQRKNVSAQLENWIDNIFRRQIRHTTNCTLTICSVRRKRIIKPLFFQPCIRKMKRSVKKIELELRENVCTKFCTFEWTKVLSNFDRAETFFLCARTHFYPSHVWVCSFITDAF